MAETTAAHCSLRQQKSALTNLPSPVQPIATNNKNLASVYPLLNMQPHSFIKQPDNRSGPILKLSIRKPCYSSFAQLTVTFTVTGFLSFKFADVRLQRFVVDGQDRLAQGLNQEGSQVWHGERQVIKQMRAHLHFWPRVFLGVYELCSIVLVW